MPDYLVDLAIRIPDHTRNGITFRGLEYHRYGIRKSLADRIIAKLPPGYLHATRESPTDVDSQPDPPVG